MYRRIGMTAAILAGMLAGALFTCGTPDASAAGAPIPTYPVVQYRSAKELPSAGYPKNALAFTLADGATDVRLMQYNGAGTWANASPTIFSGVTPMLTQVPATGAPYSQPGDAGIAGVLKAGTLKASSALVGGGTYTLSTGKFVVKASADLDQIVMDAASGSVEQTGHLLIQAPGAGAAGFYVSSGGDQTTRSIAVGDTLVAAAPADVYASTQATPLVYAGIYGSSGRLVASGGVYIGGAKVVGSQQAGITDPTGGVTQDAECRTAVIAVISALEAHGLIVTTP